MSKKIGTRERERVEKFWKEIETIRKRGRESENAKIDRVENTW